MKILIAISIFISSLSYGQVILRPSISLSSIGIKMDIMSYNNVNWSPSPGLELEKTIYRFANRNDTLGTKPKPSLSLQVSIFYNNNFSDLSGYNANGTALLSSEIKTRYINIPVLLKYHFPASFLDSRITLNYALGITTGFLLDMDMKETSLKNTFDVDGNFLGTVYSESSGNVKSYARSQVFYITFGMYFSHRKLSAGFLVGFSPSDQYLKGLENNWGLPANESMYLGSYQAFQKVQYEYANFIVSYRIN
jgi:hypothetical protein